MDENDFIRYGEVRGGLAAFARLNDKTDHGYTFTLDALPLRGDVRQTLRDHLAADLSALEIEAVPDPPGALAAALAGWLFRYLADTLGGTLADERRAFALSDAGARAEEAAGLARQILALAGPGPLWRVSGEPQGFYECQWDDLALESAGAVFLLHLGVSD